MEWGFNHAYAEAVRGGDAPLDKDLWLGTSSRPDRDPPAPARDRRDPRSRERDPQRYHHHRDRDHPSVAPDRDGPLFPDRGSPLRHCPHRGPPRDRDPPSWAPDRGLAMVMPAVLGMMITEKSITPNHNFDRCLAGDRGLASDRGLAAGRGLAGARGLAGIENSISINKSSEFGANRECFQS